MLRPCRALEFTAISIADDGDYAGRLSLKPIHSLHEREVWALCGILVAGYEAESKAVGSPAAAHAKTDLRQVRDWLEQLAEPGVAPADPRSVISLSRRLHLEIRELVTGHWPPIERLAAGLLRHETLTADRARQLVVPPPASA